MMGTHSGKDVSEIPERVDLILFTAGNKAVNNRCSPSSSFAGSDASAKRATVIYRLIASCKLCEIDPFEYIRDVLDRISTHPASKIVELTPSGWEKHLIARN